MAPSPARRTLLRLAPALLLVHPAESVAQAFPALRAFRVPGCGCCEGWAEHLRRAGFVVTLEDAPDLDAVRRAAGVPSDLAGCHTGLLGDPLVVEGHVPGVALRRFLDAPGSWRGLAVPGMPAGAPGMEMPGVEPDAYTIFAFAADGRRAPFMTMRGDRAA